MLLRALSPAIPKAYQEEDRPLTFDWDLKFEREPTRLAHAYWESRCRDGGPPARSDLVLPDMRKFMGHLGLVDVPAGKSNRDYLVRLAGSRWEVVFGPMRGKRLDEFLAPSIEARWRAAFDPVCVQSRAARVTTQLELEGKRWLDCEMLIAPLSDGGQVTMLLMCFAA
jgi:hypothetical protein